MSFSKEVWVLIETSQTQIWEAQMNMIWTVEWEDAIIGLNGEYLLEVLWVIDKTHVSLSFESPLSAILIVWISEDSKKDWFRHIIMPLKI
jgi:DNA polymerase III sliding clamp (beta) subunit (PCNA family)